MDLCTKTEAARPHCISSLQIRKCLFHNMLCRRWAPAQRGQAPNGKNWNGALPTTRQIPTTWSPGNRSKPKPSPDSGDELAHRPAGDRPAPSLTRPPIGTSSVAAALERISPPPSVAFWTKLPPNYSNTLPWSATCERPLHTGSPFASTTARSKARCRPVRLPLLAGPGHLEIASMSRGRCDPIGFLPKQLSPQLSRLLV
jgi:hypothetical protein